MLDGKGMCGTCRIKFRNKNKFSCNDDPIFDYEKIVFLDITDKQKTNKEKKFLF